MSLARPVAVLLRVLVVVTMMAASATVHAPSVRASACCLSTAVGTGRLFNGEQAAFGLTKSTAYTLGRWTSSGEWRAYDDYGELEFKATLWGMASIGERSTLSLYIPAILNHRWTGDSSATGGFLGDINLGFRWDPLKVGEHATLPAVALVFGVSAPTGRVMGSDTGHMGEGATGRGAWSLSAGVVLEKAVVPWFVRLEAIANVPLPGDLGPGGSTLWFGPGISGSLTGGYGFTSTTTLALAWRFMWESEQRIDGQRIANSEKFDMGLALSLSVRFHDNWTVTSTIDTGIFADGAGDNGFGRVTATCGIRYGIF